MIAPQQESLVDASAKNRFGAFDAAIVSKTLTEFLFQMPQKR